MDALEGSYLHYLKNAGDMDFDTDFKNVIYHMPFPGMAFQAHRLLCNLARPRKKAEVKESFEEKVRPSLRYSQRVGSTYGASNFVGLCGLINSVDPLKEDDRIGFFSYGSGAIGEFYSGFVLPEAKRIIEEMKIDESFDARKKVSVDEYEEIEKIRESYIENPNFTPDFSVVDDWYKKHYEGSGLLVLKEVKDYYRFYEWS
jgi:hydroxymethylglutaryl-CoA synthase